MLINYYHTSFNDLDYKHRLQIIYPIFYILLYAMNACTRGKPYQNNMVPSTRRFSLRCLGVNQVWVVFNLLIVIFISPWNWLTDHLWPLALKLSIGEASNLIHERQKDSHSC